MICAGNFRIRFRLHFQCFLAIGHWQCRPQAGPWQSRAGPAAAGLGPASASGRPGPACTGYVGQKARLTLGLPCQKPGPVARSGTGCVRVAAAGQSLALSPSLSPSDGAGWPAGPRPLTAGNGVSSPCSIISFIMMQRQSLWILPFNRDRDWLADPAAARPT